MNKFSRYLSQCKEIQMFMHPRPSPAAGTHGGQYQLLLHVFSTGWYSRRAKMA